jgi:hypothetical protein
MFIFDLRSGTQTHIFKEIHVYFGLYDQVHVRMFKQIHVYFGLYHLVQTHV